MNDILYARIVLLALQFLPILLFTVLPLYAVKARLEDKTTLVQKLFCFFFACAMVSFCFVYARLLNAPRELHNTARAPLYSTSFLCFFLCLLNGALFFTTLFKKLPLLFTEEALSRAWRYLLAIPVTMTVLFLWASPRKAEVVMTGRVRITTLIFLFLFPPFFWLIIHGAWWITVRMRENARVKAENDLLQMEGKRYRELKEYMEQTRTLRHDFRSHLNIIYGLAQTGEVKELISYLDSYTGSLKDTPSLYSANQSVDAIASHYAKMAKDQGAVILWSLQLPEKLPVPEYDFCAVLGNLVENALRAVKKLPEKRRVIQVNAQMLSDMMLGLSVKNEYEGEVLLDKDHLPRSKRAGHGIGLVSVQHTVRKYHGTLDIKTEDGCFTVAVLLSRQ